MRQGLGSAGRDHELSAFGGNHVEAALDALGEERLAELLEEGRNRNPRAS